MIGYPSTRAGKLERYCPLGIARFVPAIKFRRTLSGCKKAGFLSKNIFRDSKKIFGDFSVGMELENGKTQRVNENENKENKNVDEFQEYISQQKPANTKVKKAWNTI